LRNQGEYALSNILPTSNKLPRFWSLSLISVCPNSYENHMWIEEMVTAHLFGIGMETVCLLRLLRWAKVCAW
jgi:hypothetical protein